MNQSFVWALLVQIFVPFTIHPPSSRSARVDTDARSEPLSGSLMPIEKPSSPAQIFGRNRARCSSLPNLLITAPVWRSLTQWYPTGAPQRSISSTTTKRSTAVRSLPPHSLGSAMPTQPRSAIFFENAGSWRADIPNPGSWLPGGSSSVRNSRTSDCSASSSVVSFGWCESHRIRS